MKRKGRKVELDISKIFWVKVGPPFWGGKKWILRRLNNDFENDNDDDGDDDGDDDDYGDYDGGGDDGDGWKS